MGSSPESFHLETAHQLRKRNGLAIHRPGRIGLDLEGAGKLEPASIVFDACADISLARFPASTTVGKR
jgi:hypothetical protein